jgi:hypothetical protein
MQGSDQCSMMFCGKMVSDDDEQSKISKQVDDYERSEGECFSKPGAIRDRDRKNPSKF